MLQLEKRFARDPSLAEAYRDSMREAIELNHLRPCTRAEINDKKNVYFIPHHPVIKTSSTTTKVRPVFDASASHQMGNH